MSRLTKRRGILTRIAMGAAAALLLGSGVATAAPEAAFIPNTDPDSAPSSRPAAGPEKNIRAGSRPVSGKTPKAGPTFTDVSGVWQVNTTEAVLRNTVTDPDGDKANLTFEVYTTDANGNPKTQVKLDDSQYGVLVSDYVASGKTAEVKVPYGKLKPGVTYTFHTSAYDGGLYETEWSPWAKFKIRDRVVDIKLPEPDQGAAAVNLEDYQEPQQIDQPAMRAVEPTQPPLNKGLRTSDGWHCGELNQKTGIQPCSRIVPDHSAATKKALTKAMKMADLANWCATYTNSHIKRTEACIGGFNYEYEGIVVKDGKPTGEILNASWAVGQQYKLSPTTGTIEEKITLVPVTLDEKFVSVTLNVEMDCLLATDCATDNTSQKWDGALEWTVGDWHTAEGSITHTWNGGTTADTSQMLDLSAKITGYAAVANPSAIRWQAVDAQIRCDTIASTKPGCVFHKYIPTWVMNFKKYPAAVAHGWLIQSKLPNHPGSESAGKPMKYLPQASKNAHNHDPQRNRDVICPKGSDGKSWASVYGNPDATLLPEIKPTDTPSCDEFAYASTYNSGGMPASIGGLNEVTSGDACVQTYATRVKQGEWHLYDDIREAAPTWKEVCGRSTMSGWINSGSMAGFPGTFAGAGKYHLLDEDKYWVRFPEFEHCDASQTTVKCTVPKA